MMLHGILKDPVLFSALEADLLQHYNVDIYTFFREEMYVRRLINLILNLPADSRLIKRQRNDPIDLTHHTTMSVVDALNLLNFQMYYVAAAGIGKDWKKIFKNAPKPGERPVYVEVEKPKKQFMTGRQLANVVEEAKTKVIAHTESCVKSRINEGGGVIRCGCPPEGPKQK